MDSTAVWQKVSLGTTASSLCTPPTCCMRLFQLVRGTGVWLQHCHTCTWHGGESWQRSGLLHIVLLRACLYCRDASRATVLEAAGISNPRALAVVYTARARLVSTVHSLREHYPNVSLLLCFYAFCKPHLCWSCMLFDLHCMW